MTTEHPSSHRRAWSAIGVTLTAGCLGTAVLGQMPAFRARADTIAVYATVRDAAGRFVPDLAKESFLVFDNGRPVNVTSFSSDPQPLSVAMMLHMSQGASWGRFDIRSAVLKFGDALRPEDRMSLGSFGIEIAVGANLTNDRGEIARVLDEEMWKGGGSPLWQAIRAAGRSLAHERGRRVVLVVTNGRDTGDVPGFEGGRSGAERQALQEECMVYVVLFQNNRDRAIDDDVARLAEATGGGHFAVPAGSDLQSTMAQVADELRHQYLLGFAPTALDGRVHTLEVRVTKPGLKANARRSYLAPAVRAGIE